MRPSGITDGIRRLRVEHVREARAACFNEAVGYYRRNLSCAPAQPPDRSCSASMRPSGITDGIAWKACEDSPFVPFVLQ